MSSSADKYLGVKGLQSSSSLNFRERQHTSALVTARLPHSSPVGGGALPPSPNNQQEEKRRRRRRSRSLHTSFHTIVKRSELQIVGCIFIFYIFVQKYLTLYSSSSLHRYSWIVWSKYVVIAEVAMRLCVIGVGGDRQQDRLPVAS